MLCQAAIAIALTYRLNKCYNIQFINNLADKIAFCNKIAFYGISAKLAFHVLHQMYFLKVRREKSIRQLSPEEILRFIAQQFGEIQKKGPQAQQLEKYWSDVKWVSSLSNSQLKQTDKEILRSKPELQKLWNIGLSESIAKQVKELNIFFNRLLTNYRDAQDNDAKIIHERIKSKLEQLSESVLNEFFLFLNYESANAAVLMPQKNNSIFLALFDSRRCEIFFQRLAYLSEEQILFLSDLLIRPSIQSEVHEENMCLFVQNLSERRLQGWLEIFAQHLDQVIQKKLNHLKDEISRSKLELADPSSNPKRLAQLKLEFIALRVRCNQEIKLIDSLPCLSERLHNFREGFEELQRQNEENFNYCRENRPKSQLSNFARVEIAEFQDDDDIWQFIGGLGFFGDRDFHSHFGMSSDAFALFCQKKGVETISDLKRFGIFPEDSDVFGLSVEALQNEANRGLLFTACGRLIAEAKKNKRSL